LENKTLYGTEDGLIVNEDVGSWSPDKYGQIRLYSQIFTSGMKNRWSNLTYLDLYAGAGQSRVKGTNELLLGSPLIALSVDHQFGHYIFCEKNPAKLSALKDRVITRFPEANVTYIEGDSDDPTFDIGSFIPSGSLTLCLVDPYSIDIRFETIRSLAKDRKIDFLCLLASRMDAGRNPHNYPKEECKKVDLLLDSATWRVDWERHKAGQAREPNLGDFICEEFSRKMETLGYLPTPLHEMRPIKLDNGNTIYHLALYARHPKAKEFWMKASTSADPQKDLPFE